MFFNILKLVEDLDVKSHRKADFFPVFGFPQSCFPFPSAPELSERTGESNFHYQEEVNLFMIFWSMVEFLIDASLKKS